MKAVLLAVAAFCALTAAKPCAPDHDELILRLNKDLLRSTEDLKVLPNPSVHLALRLSTHHNLAKENQYLNRLKTQFHQNLQSSLDAGQAVVGKLALYVLALRSSCHDLTSLTLTIDQTPNPLLTQLKRELEKEKEHIALNNRPLTTYYQYSLGMLALCVGGVRVSAHVTHKLVHAVHQDHMKNEDFASVDSYAMAGLALQCLKEAGTELRNVEELDKALTTIKQKLLDSQRADGHLGNEFSTGLALQALQAMGSGVMECSAPMEALRSSARKGSYHSAMALSQSLPTLQQRTYLHLRGSACLNEDDSLVLDDELAVKVLSSLSTVPVQVEVLKADGSSTEYRFEVPSGSSLLEVLTLLQDHQMGFTFETEDSLWGTFLSRINGEQARQTDRRYWHLSTDGTALTQGLKDFKISASQKITIKNMGY